MARELTETSEHGLAGNKSRKQASRRERERMQFGEEMQRWRREDPYEGPGGESSEAFPLLLTHTISFLWTFAFLLSLDCIQIVILYFLNQDAGRFCHPQSSW